MTAKRGAGTAASWAPLFARRRVGSYVVTMVEASNRLVSSWQDAARTGAVVDLTEAGLGYALDILGHAVFGEDMGSAAEVLHETVPVMNEHVTRRALSPVRLPPWWPTPTSRRAGRARQSLRALVDGLIANRKAGALDGSDLLSLLLSARDPHDGSALDDLAVRDQALIFLLAGHETAGSALAFALHLLGRHETVQERVRQEVASVAGTGAIGPDAVDRLAYTAQVVNEAMRLYPPAHILVRRAQQPATCSGREVEPGQFMAVSIWGIHHNPGVWPEPDRFDPDRFGAGTVTTDGDPDGQSSRYRHLPFGGGPRGCIGQHLAFAELVVAVATVVRAYRLESVADGPDLHVRLTLKPGGELPCRLRPA